MNRRQRTTLTIALAAALIAGAALAQKVVTYRPADVSLTLVELRPATADGGSTLTVYAKVQADGDSRNVIERSNQCDVGAMNATQKACVVTLRQAAKQCWQTEEGL